MGEKRSRAVVIAIAVAAFVLLCVIISVAVGNLLGEKAENLLDREPFDFSDAEYYSGEKLVKSVDAYAYQWSSDAKGYIASGIVDLSVCLRASDGALTYASDVAALMGNESFSEFKKLSEYVEYVHSLGGRVCGYFYVNSFYQSDEYLRKLYEDYEIALINEAARSGVDDILLVGFAIADTSINAVEQYVSRAAFAAENSALGVLLQENLLSDENYLAARVRSVCDYIALDLRHYDTEVSDMSGEEQENAIFALLERNEYYIEAFEMRLVLSKENSHFYSLFKKLGVKNIQIIGK